jgi:excisionase family DNA binding protein
MRALGRLEALSARVQKTLDVPGGITVSQAAERLAVSEPTVRKWLAEGLLGRVEGRRPVEITQRSVIEVERVLEAVRESYPARRWSEALAAFLHDRDLLDQGWAREGIEQLRRGELVER